MDKKKSKIWSALNQMSQTVLKMFFLICVFKSCHRPSRKETAKKINQDSIWIREIHRGCAKEEDQKGAGWLPTCRELECICNVVASLLSPKKDPPHLGLIPELVSICCGGSRWRLLRQLCCDAASGMVTENRSGDGKPAVQDPGIHFEISVISTMSSCFHEFYLEPSWSSLFKTLIFGLSCWYILFLFFKQIKLI